MSYAEFSDLQFLMPDETILRLSNDDPEATEIDQDVVSALLESASAEIDAAFADGGIKLPLSNNPPAVVELCAILTRCRLYARRPEGYEIPDAVVNACKDARQTLKDIAAGKITLGAKGSEEETAANYIGGKAKTAAPYSLMQDFVDYTYAGMPSIRATQRTTTNTDKSDSGSSETANVDLSDYYNKNETDALLNAKANTTALANYYDKASVNTLLAAKASAATFDNYYEKTTVDSLLAKKANAADVDIASFYNKTQTDALLAKKADTTALASYYTKTQVDQEITKKVPTNFYSKTEVDSKLSNKADKATLTNDYSNNSQLATKLAAKADKTALADYYTQSQTQEYIAAQIKNIDHYNKTEANQLLSGKVDTATLTADYTNNAELKKLLDAKVSTADLDAAVKTRQEEQAALQASVLTTAGDLQSQITTMQGKLTDASNNMETSLTTMQSSLTSTAESINTRYDELVANVTKVSGELNAKDTALQTDIDAIEALIPSAATADNQLADKAYVSDLVKTSAARAISADADGAGFESLAALKAGPWYSLGESVTPTTNDYAVVKKDATHSGNDVRYNFDGAVWVFFQEFSSGGGSSTLELTTAQTNALNSGITAALVAKIDTNANGLAVEITDRKNEDTTLLARISTEESTRETAVNNLTAGIAAEKLARENADNQTLAAVETEKADRISADNEIKALVNTKQTALETTIGALATLNTDVKTSIVECINDLHDELHGERVAKAGDTMTGQLKIVSAGTSDLLHLQGGDKGVTFRMDATAGAMSIVPVSAQTMGFEVSANKITPRTTDVEYSLGSNTNYWTNAFITNLNGKTVDSLAEDADIENLQSQITESAQNLAAKVNKTGDTMSGTLKIVSAASGDLIHLEGGGKGITFTMDADTGFMHLIPVSLPLTGFEFSATSFTPRTSGVGYALGSNSLPWANAYITNLNGVAVDDYVTQSELEQHSTAAAAQIDALSANLQTETQNRENLAAQVYTKTQTDSLLANKADASALNSKANSADLAAKANTADVYTKTETDLFVQNLEDRLYILENTPAPTALYFFLPTQQLILSSAADKYAENFETNIPLANISFVYAETGKSTFTLESATKLKFHYVSGSSQNAKFTVIYTPTGEEIGYGYLCTSSNGGYASKILWAGVSA